MLFAFAVLSHRFDIFQVHTERPLAQPLNRFDRFFIAAQIMPGVDATTNQRMTVFDHIDRVADLIVKSVRSVVVNRDGDSVFLAQFVEQVKRLVVFLRIRAERHDAHGLGKVKGLASFVFVPVETEHSVSDQFDASVVQHFFLSSNVFRQRPHRHVCRIGFPVFQTKGFRMFQSGYCVEASQ